MQSLVDAFGVFLNHSITILSSSSPAGTTFVVTPAPCAFRFFVFGGAAVPVPFGDVGETAAKSSVAFRLLLGLCDPLVEF